MLKDKEIKKVKISDFLDVLFGRFFCFFFYRGYLGDDSVGGFWFLEILVLKFRFIGLLVGSNWFISVSLEGLYSFFEVWFF